MCLIFKINLYLFLRFFNVTMSRGQADLPHPSYNTDVVQSVVPLPATVAFPEYSNGRSLRWHKSEKKRERGKILIFLMVLSSFNFSKTRYGYPLGCGSYLPLKKFNISQFTFKLSFMLKFFAQSKKTVLMGSLWE